MWNSHKLSLCKSGDTCNPLSSLFVVSVLLDNVYLGNKEY
jgi:hypothetical protein